MPVSLQIMSNPSLKLKRVETEDRKVLFYFDEVTYTRLQFMITIFEGVITLFKVLRLPCLMCESQLHESDSFDDTDFEQTFHCLNVCGWAAKELAKPCSWLTNLSFELQIPSSRKVCVKVLFQRAFDVGKPQPSSASVYSYYEPGTRWYSQ